MTQCWQLELPKNYETWPKPTSVLGAKALSLDINSQCHFVLASWTRVKFTTLAILAKAIALFFFLIRTKCIFKIEKVISLSLKIPFRAMVQYLPETFAYLKVSHMWWSLQIKCIVDLVYYPKRWYHGYGLYAVHQEKNTEGLNWNRF